MTTEKITITIEVLRYCDELGEPACACDCGCCVMFDEVNEHCAILDKKTEEYRDTGLPAPLGGCPVWRSK